MHSKKGKTSRAAKSRRRRQKTMGDIHSGHLCSVSNDENGGMPRSNPNANHQSSKSENVEQLLSMSQTTPIHEDTFHFLSSDDEVMENEKFRGRQRSPPLRLNKMSVSANPPDRRQAKRFKALKSKQRMNANKKGNGNRVGNRKRNRNGHRDRERNRNGNLESLTPITVTPPEGSSEGEDDYPPMMTNPPLTMQEYTGLLLKGF